MASVLQRLIVCLTLIAPLACGGSGQSHRTSSQINESSLSMDPWENWVAAVEAQQAENFSETLATFLQAVANSPHGAMDCGHQEVEPIIDDGWSGEHPFFNRLSLTGISPTKLYTRCGAR